MVQYLPGPEQLLAPAAQQITEGVLNFLNPHRQFQQAVQQSIAQNPDIAQHFANLEASSPGLLRSLGIGRLASLPPTPEKQYEITNREGIISGLEADRDAKTSASRYTSKNVQDALQLIKDRPDLGMDAALKMMTGQTNNERIISDLGARRAEAGQAAMNIPGIYGEAGINAATGQSGADLAKSQLLQEGITNAQELVSQGPEVTLQRFRANAYSPKQLLGIFSSPLGEALKAQIDDYNNRARIDLMTGRGSDAMERLQYSSAVRLQEALRDPSVSVDDVIRWMNEAGAAKTGADVASGKAKGTPEDSVMGKISEGVSRLQAGTVSKVTKEIDADILSNVIRLNSKDLAGPKGEDTRKMLVNSIDQKLAEKAALPGGQRYTATWEKVPRGPLDRPGDIIPRIDQFEMVIRGPDGKIVSSDEALRGSSSAPKSAPVDSSQGKSGLSSNKGLGTLTPNMLNDFANTYKNAKEGEKAALVARWKAEAPPEAWAQIAAKLGVK